MKLTKWQDLIYPETMNADDYQPILWYPAWLTEREDVEWKWAFVKNIALFLIIVFAALLSFPHIHFVGIVAHAAYASSFLVFCLCVRVMRTVRRYRHGRYGNKNAGETLLIRCHIMDNIVHGQYQPPLPMLEKK